MTLRLLASLIACLCAFAATAQEYPSRPVRIVVPFPAGGGTDILARIIGQRMSEKWSQPVVVDNRPGGNTLIGAQEVARAAPDGHSLLMAIDSTLVMNQFLYRKLPYDPLKDFTAVTIAAYSPLIIVTDAATGPKSIDELIRRAKQNPGKLNYGFGTITTQMGGELLKRTAGVQMTAVPYKGSSATLQGLLAGDVNFTIDGATAYLSYINSGKLRALANASTRPIAGLPDLQRLGDMRGFAGFDVIVWLGLVAPAKTSPAVVAKIHQEVARITALPEVKEKLAASGLEPASSASPAEFAAFIRREAARWSKLIPETGIRLE